MSRADDGGEAPRGGLPVAPSMAAALESIRAPQQDLRSGRLLLVSGLAAATGAAAGFIAQLLGRLIALITNLAFHGRVSTAAASPVDHHLGPLVIVVPVAGALIVGVMARYGSKAIRGHGIPEAMERVLYHESRIPARLMFLKPLSAAIAIGTGGPFGAEGPIIATGGALGSYVGQIIRMTADERKTLLAAGAAAGMSATFGSPVSAVLLAIELLLFELRPRSIVPVALAAVVANGMRIALVGSAPAFAVVDLAQPSDAALAVYVLVGAVVGVASVGVTRLVYAIEDAFERLPIHWMWWPAIGGLAVGAIGFFAPRTMGVGYENIEQTVSGTLAGTALAVLVLLKLASWAISLGSGTSGGTLAPLFTIGGGLGALLGSGAALLAPGWGVDPRVAALVGMAAMFAGASRALLASVVFAFETTRQPLGLLPLLGGCSAGYFLSSVLMPNTIMTEKLARRGARIPSEYAADFLDQVLVRDAASTEVVTLAAAQTLGEVRSWLASGADGTTHQGFPVLDGKGELVGVVTRRDLLAPLPDADPVTAVIARPAAVIFDDSSLREAADHMVGEGVGRLPVVERSAPRRVVGMVSRSDLLAAHGRRLDAARRIQSRRRLTSSRLVDPASQREPEAGARPEAP